MDDAHSKNCTEHRTQCSAIPRKVKVFDYHHRHHYHQHQPHYGLP